MSRFRESAIVLETRCGCIQVIIGVSPTIREWRAPLRPEPTTRIVADEAVPTTVRADCREFRDSGRLDGNGWRIFREVGP
jgi:hypothetical protein